MSEEIIVRQCAPTLADMKSGNMFLYKFEDRAQMICDIRSFNQNYVSKGLSMVPLRFSGDKVLLLLMRPERLKNDLQDATAKQLLSRFGYKDRASCSMQLGNLVKRFKNINEFPHEIGLFLSYPPEDVKGFIDNNAKECKCVGTWKVYGDEKKARKTFREYKNCTEHYCRLWNSGVGLEQLATM